jgi:hypothetical protein
MNKLGFVKIRGFIYYFSWFRHNITNVSSCEENVVDLKINGIKCGNI